MTESLIDTDILSFYFKGEVKVVEAFSRYVRNFGQINIPIVTYYEIIGGLTYKDAKKQLSLFDEFVANNNIIYISEESARISGNLYGQLRKNGVTIGASDLLIAGIAIENDLTLNTNNEKHYEVIPGLKIGNWMR